MLLRIYTAKLLLKTTNFFLKYATQTPMQKWKPSPVVSYLLLQNNFPTQFLKWSVLTELL